MCNILLNIQIIVQSFTICWPHVVYIYILVYIGRRIVSTCNIILYAQFLNHNAEGPQLKWLKNEIILKGK